MYILHVTREIGSDSRYGIRKSLQPVIDALQLRGHTIELFDQQVAENVPTNRLEQFLENMYLRKMKNRFGDHGLMAWHVLKERIVVGQRAAKYASQKRFTHVHCHDPLLAYSFGFFATLYGATKNVGYTAHAFGRFVKLRMGIETSVESLHYLQKWEDKMALKAKWVVVPTKVGFEQMRKDLNLKVIPRNWHVVSHSVIKPNGNRLESRKSLRLSEETLLLLAVGQLNAMKRFSLLLESVALLPSELKLHILILGEGEEKQRLYDLAIQLNLKGKLDIRVTDNIGEYLYAADVYVSVSSTESFGMANCEAVLAGIPSVCTRVGAVPELLGACALLVDDKPHEIAAAITKVLSSENHRKEMARKAKKITRLWPSPDDVADQMENIFYDSVTGIRK